MEIPGRGGEQQKSANSSGRGRTLNGFVLWALLVFALTQTLFAKARVDTSSSLVGKGLRVVARDFSFYVQLRFQVQPNYMGFCTEAQNGSDASYIDRWSIRRSREKLDGWALTPKLVYTALLVRRRKKD